MSLEIRVHIDQLCPIAFLPFTANSLKVQSKNKSPPPAFHFPCNLIQFSASLLLCNCPKTPDAVDIPFSSPGLPNPTLLISQATPAQAFTDYSSTYSLSIVLSMAFYLVYTLFLRYLKLLSLFSLTFQSRPSWITLNICNISSQILSYLQFVQVSQSYTKYLIYYIC